MCLGPRVVFLITRGLIQILRIQIGSSWSCCSNSLGCIGRSPDSLIQISAAKTSHRLGSFVIGEDKSFTIWIFRRKRLSLKLLVNVEWWVGYLRALSGANSRLKTWSSLAVLYIYWISINTRFLLVWLVQKERVVRGFSPVIIAIWIWRISTNLHSLAHHLKLAFLEWNSHFGRVVLTQRKVEFVCFASFFISVNFGWRLPCCAFALISWSEIAASSNAILRFSLVKNVRVHTKVLKQFLSFLVVFFPRTHVELTSSSHKSVQKKLILIVDLLLGHPFFVSKFTDNLLRGYIFTEKLEENWINLN